MGVIFRDDDDEEEEEYTGQTGDPLHDAIYGWDMGSGYDDDDYGRHQSYQDHSSYGGYRPQVSREQVNRRMLESKKNAYERKLKEARRESDDEYRIRYYGEALEYAQDYFEESEKLGIAIDGMPDRNHLLSKKDVDWISKKHYDEFFKIHILSTDQTENLEKLLKESGNGHRIKSNEETRRAESRANAKRMGIDHANYQVEDYFKRIKKANDFALNNKPRHAIKEYQRAVNIYGEFFQSRYATDSMKRKMPATSLTSDAVDNIIVIYCNTHPLLKSNRVNEKINRQIIDMLREDWSDRLSEADREVLEIREQRNLERQKRKEKVEDIAVDVIVGARIVGNGILNRLRK